MTLPRLLVVVIAIISARRIACKRGICYDSCLPVILIWAMWKLMNRSILIFGIRQSWSRATLFSGGSDPINS